MNERISIIIPIYNAEKYLLDCLESVLQQTYQNCELLLIDDGSTDKSNEIAAKFCEDHPEGEIQFFTKKNGGQSTARNLGIKKATGTYIIFIDSDDLVSSSHVEMLYTAVKTNNVELAMCKMTKKLTELSDQPINEPVVLSGDFLTLVDTLYASDYHAVSASAKIYHHSLLKKSQFYEGIIYEDGLFFYEIINQIDTIVLIDCASYYYRTSENSTLTSEISQKNFDILKKNELTYDFFVANHPEALVHFYIRALNVNDFIAVKCMQDKTELSKDLVNKLYRQNKKYSKYLFPRKFVYQSKFVYIFFITCLSKVVTTTDNGEKNKLKELIRKFSK